MFYRSLFVPSLLLTSILGFATSAKASSAPVIFNATVPAASCTLTNMQPGSLGLNGANTTLSSSTTGGSAAKIDINCPSGGNLSISAPSRTGGTAPVTTFSSLTSSITTTNNITANSSGTATPITALANGTANVNMEATSSAALGAGTYVFSVTVTATP
jgi:hypothetical protein